MKNWRDIGGKEWAVKLITEEKNSKSREMLVRHIMKEIMKEIRGQIP